MAHKRLIVACDGTWVHSDNGFQRDSWLPWKTSGRLATSSNVSRICRALFPRSADGIPQIVYYQAGLGSQNNAYSYFIGGYLGSGISENIREAYAFICSNYEDGDEIFLIGFSRGAFTARSIGGLIADIGLLTPKGLDSFYPVFKDWEHQVDPSYQPECGSSAWPITRPKWSDPSYVPKLVEAGLTRPHIPVKAIAVWDTVGTLGVPEVNVLGLKLFTSNRKEYSFQRKTFSPTIWESPKSVAGDATARLKLLKQCWFPGVHSNVGGGYPDTSIADITLAWMVTQLARHLTFDPEYVLLQRKQNVRFYADQNVPVCSWAMGQIKKSDAGLLNTLTGRQARTPGEYYATDPVAGTQVGRKLTDTCEFVHPSVRLRIQQKGPGLATSTADPGQGVYSPVTLRGWTYCAPGQLLPDKNLQVDRSTERWGEHGKWIVQRADGSVTFIVEDRVEEGSEDMLLVEAWPGVAENPGA
ncbi:hypothetical protein LTR08_008552 [Meristemomyces frigidus]|nr:hypothetical protein LTR08_008552 [Meristemomyces frigidus]